MRRGYNDSDSLLIRPLRPVSDEVYLMDHKAKQ